MSVELPPSTAEAIISDKEPKDPDRALASDEQAILIGEVDRRLEVDPTTPIHIGRQWITSKEQLKAILTALSAQSVLATSGFNSDGRLIIHSALNKSENALKQ